MGIWWMWEENAQGQPMDKMYYVFGRFSDRFSLLSGSRRFLGVASLGTLERLMSNSGRLSSVWLLTVEV